MRKNKKMTENYSVKDLVSKLKVLSENCVSGLNFCYFYKSFPSSKDVFTVMRNSFENALDDRRCSCISCETCFHCFRNEDAFINSFEKLLIFKDYINAAFTLEKAACCGKCDSCPFAIKQTETTSRSCKIQKLQELRVENMQKYITSLISLIMKTEPISK